MERPQSSLRNCDQLDGEVEGGAPWESSLGNAAVAVSEMSGNSQGPGLTLTHSGHAAFVSLNDLKTDFRFD